MLSEEAIREGIGERVEWSCEERIGRLGGIRKGRIRECGRGGGKNRDLWAKGRKEVEESKA